MVVYYNNLNLMKDIISSLPEEYFSNISSISTNILNKYIVINDIKYTLEPISENATSYYIKNEHDEIIASYNDTSKLITIDDNNIINLNDAIIAYDNSWMSRDLYIFPENLDLSNMEIAYGYNFQTKQNFISFTDDDKNQVVFKYEQTENGIFQLKNTNDEVIGIMNTNNGTIDFSSAGGNNDPYLFYKNKCYKISEDSLNSNNIEHITFNSNNIIINNNPNLKYNLISIEGDDEISYIQDLDGKNVGIYNSRTNQIISLGQDNSIDLNESCVMSDNQYFKITGEPLDTSTINSVALNLEDENKTININVNTENGTENISCTLEELYTDSNGNIVYTIKNTATQQTIALYNSGTKEIVSAGLDNSLNLNDLAITQNNTYVNLQSVDITSISSYFNKVNFFEINDYVFEFTPNSVGSDYAYRLTNSKGEIVFQLTKHDSNNYSVENGGIKDFYVRNLRNGEDIRIRDIEITNLELHNNFNNIEGYKFFKLNNIDNPFICSSTPDGDGFYNIYGISDTMFGAIDNPSVIGRINPITGEIDFSNYGGEHIRYTMYNNKFYKFDAENYLEKGEFNAINIEGSSVSINGVSGYKIENIPGSNLKYISIDGRNIALYNPQSQQIILAGQNNSIRLNNYVRLQNGTSYSLSGNPLSNIQNTDSANVIYVDEKPTSINIDGTTYQLQAYSTDGDNKVYYIQDTNGKSIAVYDAETNQIVSVGSNNRIDLDNYVETENGAFSTLLNTPLTDVSNTSYVSIDNANNRITIGENIYNIEPCVRDGTTYYYIKDGSNKVGIYDPNTNQIISAGNGNSIDFDNVLTATSNGNSYLNLSSLEINSLSYTTGDNPTITLNGYNFNLTNYNEENGSYKIAGLDGTIFNPTTGQLEIPNGESFYFAFDNENNFYKDLNGALPNLSNTNFVNINYSNNQPTSITIDNTTYTLESYSTEDGNTIYYIKDGNNNLGIYNSETKEIVSAGLDNSLNLNDLAITEGNGYYALSNEPLNNIQDITSVAINGSEIVITIGNNSTPYTIEPVEVGNTIYYIKDGDVKKAIYDASKDQIIGIGSNNSNDFTNWTLTTDNIYVNLENLDINSLSYITGDNPTITINGYTFNLTNYNEENGTYKIAGLDGTEFDIINGELKILNDTTPYRFAVYGDNNDVYMLSNTGILTNNDISSFTINNNSISINGNTGYTLTNIPDSNLKYITFNNQNVAIYDPDNNKIILAGQNNSIEIGNCIQMSNNTYYNLSDTPLSNLQDINTVVVNLGETPKTIIIDDNAYELSLIDGSDTLYYVKNAEGSVAIYDSQTKRIISVGEDNSFTFDNYVEINGNLYTLNPYSGSALYPGDNNNSAINSLSDIDSIAFSSTDPTAQIYDKIELNGVEFSLRPVADNSNTFYICTTNSNNQIVNSIAIYDATTKQITTANGDSINLNNTTKFTPTLDGNSYVDLTQLDITSMSYATSPAIGNSITLNGYKFSLNNNIIGGDTRFTFNPSTGKINGVNNTETIFVCNGGVYNEYTGETIYNGYELDEALAKFDVLVQEGDSWGIPGSPYSITLGNSVGDSNLQYILMPIGDQTSRVALYDPINKIMYFAGGESVCLNNFISVFDSDIIVNAELFSSIQGLSYDLNSNPPTITLSRNNFSSSNPGYQFELIGPDSDGNYKISNLDYSVFNPVNGELDLSTYGGANIKYTIYNDKLYQFDNERCLNIDDINSVNINGSSMTINGETTYTLQNINGTNLQYIVLNDQNSSYNVGIYNTDTNEIISAGIGNSVNINTLTNHNENNFFRPSSDLSFAVVKPQAPSSMVVARPPLAQTSNNSNAMQTEINDSIIQEGNMENNNANNLPNSSTDTNVSSDFDVSQITDITSSTYSIRNKEITIIDQDNIEHTFAIEQHVYDAPKFYYSILNGNNEEIGKFDISNFQIELGGREYQFIPFINTTNTNSMIKPDNLYDNTKNIICNKDTIAFVNKNDDKSLAHLHITNNINKDGSYNLAVTSAENAPIIGTYNPNTMEILIYHSNMVNYDIYKDINGTFYKLSDEYLEKDDINTVVVNENNIVINDIKYELVPYSQENNTMYYIQDENGNNVAVYNTETNEIISATKNNTLDLDDLIQANDGTYLNPNLLQSDSIQVQINKENNTALVTLADDTTYTFDAIDQNGDGIYILKENNGDQFATYNTINNSFKLDTIYQDDIAGSIAFDKDNNYIILKDLQTQSGSFAIDDIANNSGVITVIDINDKEYSFDIVYDNTTGKYNIIDNQNLKCGTFDVLTGEMLLNNQSEPQKLLIDENGDFISQSYLQPKTLKIDASDVEGENDKITIINEDGKEYNFEVIKNSDNPDVYIIQDVNGNLVGSLNSKTGEFYIGDNEKPLSTLMKSNDGTYVDTSKLDIQDLNYDLEKGTLSIIDKDGANFEFKIENNNENDIYTIVDANGKTVGKFTPSDVESSLDLTESGGKTFKVETLSDENKKIFNTIFENNEELSDYLQRGDYEGLKKALNEELEELLGKTNPELLEKTQKVVDDMELDGVKTKEEFLGALNKSLDDNGFDGVEDIKIFPSIDDILTNPAIIATYSVASIILAALIRMLLKQLLEKKDEEEKDKNDIYFDTNTKNSSKNKNAKHAVSTPDELLNKQSNNQEIKK